MYYIYLQFTYIYVGHSNVSRDGYLYNHKYHFWF
jgi:hypothetical protein